MIVVWSKLSGSDDSLLLKVVLTLLHSYLISFVLRPFLWVIVAQIDRFWTFRCRLLVQLLPQEVKFLVSHLFFVATRIIEVTSGPAILARIDTIFSWIDTISDSLIILASVSDSVNHCFNSKVQVLTRDLAFFRSPALWTRVNYDNII